MKWLRSVAKYVPIIIRKLLPSAIAPHQELDRPDEANEATMEKAQHFRFQDLPAELRVKILESFFGEVTLGVYKKQPSCRWYH